MKKEDLLSDEFLKQFKTGEDLNGFLAQLQKRGIEAILSGELDSHLGYEKHEKTNSSNSRNGFSAMAFIKGFISPSNSTFAC